MQPIPPSLGSSNLRELREWRAVKKIRLTELHHLPIKNFNFGSPEGLPPRVINKKNNQRATTFFFFATSRIHYGTIRVRGSEPHFGLWAGFLSIDDPQSRTWNSNEGFRTPHTNCTEIHARPLQGEIGIHDTSSSWESTAPDLYKSPCGSGKSDFDLDCALLRLAKRPGAKRKRQDLV
jgi:hypothetical protein